MLGHCNAGAVMQRRRRLVHDFHADRDAIGQQTKITVGLLRRGDGKLPGRAPSSTKTTFWPPRSTIAEAGTSTPFGVSGADSGFFSRNDTRTPMSGTMRSSF